jgi:hypothetical protein
MRHLLFDRTKIPVGARLRGVAYQPEAVDAGLDISQVLPKIVNQIHEDRFCRRRVE